MAFIEIMLIAKNSRFVDPYVLGSGHWDGSGCGKTSWWRGFVLCSCGCGDRIVGFGIDLYPNG